MKTFILLAVILLIINVKLLLCDHLTLGTTEGKLFNHHSAEYSQIPLQKRVKQYFYTDKEQRIIKGIVAYDNFNSKASIRVTAGGIGHTFVNLRMKSERGNGLSYDIGIYGDETKSPIHLRYGNEDK